MTHSTAPTRRSARNRRPLVVAALGGNALLRRHEPADAEHQRRHVADAAASLAALAGDHDLVITHGNGPQVGLLALQAEAYPDVDPYPLDVLGAESEGMIGYLVELALRNLISGREVATVLTQVEVDTRDAAFQSPSKFIGPMYPEVTARRLATQRGWTVKPDGDGWRRAVASPEPQQIVEIGAVRTLLSAGAIVICTGGGGIPVTRAGAGVMTGVEAVVDKDLSAALLAEQLDADCLLLLTDVAAIQADYGTAHPRPISHATPQELAQLDLPAGSMRPKAAAAARFVLRTGRRSAIGALEDATALAQGVAGTQITATPACAGCKGMCGSGGADLTVEGMSSAATPAS